MVEEALMNIGTAFEVHHFTLLLEELADEFFVFRIRAFEDFLGAGKLMAFQHLIQ